jgi:hypothetical protein
MFEREHDGVCLDVPMTIGEMDDQADRGPDVA